MYLPYVLVDITYSLPMYEQQYGAYEELTNGLARDGIFKHSMGARNRVGI